MTKAATAAVPNPILRLVRNLAGSIATLLSSAKPPDRTYIQARVASVNVNYDVFFGLFGLFGTNARKRFGFSTVILWMVASFTPA